MSEPRSSRPAIFFGALLTATLALSVTGCQDTALPGAVSLGPIGDPCTGGDSGKLCLGVHFVAYRDSSSDPVATEKQAITIIGTVNQLWRACDIGFQIDNYETSDPTQIGLTFGGVAAENQVDDIRQKFESPSNELLAVTTGPWGAQVNAWTNMPGDGLYGSIMEASIVTYGGGIIYAHEFGHYLGLEHVADTSNLMNPVIYTDSQTLTATQCQQARATVAQYWRDMLRR